MNKKKIHPKLEHIDIPYAKMKYPTSFTMKIKYLFWYFYTPLHPFGRDTLLKLRIIRHTARQPFLIGIINVDKSLEKVIHILLKKGFANHFIAWRDNGEIISLRHTKDFIHQYHIRIFEDGEVRGHYEYTPECHPILHMREIDMEDRRDEFLEIIGTYITQ